MLLPHHLAAMKLGVRRSAAPRLPDRRARATMAPVAAWSRVEATPRITGQNDQIGDCVPTACANAIETAMGSAGIFDAVIPNGDVIAAYSAVTGYSPQNPASDQGTDPAAMFGWWQSNDLFGHRLVEAAAVDPRDPSAIRETIQSHGGVFLTIGLSLENQNQRVWMPDGTSGSWGHHAIWADEFDGGILFCTSWGEVQPIDWRYVSGGFVDSAFALTLQAH